MPTFAESKDSAKVKKVSIVLKRKIEKINDECAKSQGQTEIKKLVFILSDEKTADETISIAKINEQNDPGKNENIDDEMKGAAPRNLATTHDDVPKFDVIKCQNPLRDKLREIISQALSKVSGEAKEEIRDEVNKHDPFQVAVSVESALFQKWGKFNGPHKLRYRSIIYNINDPQNPDFRRKVLLGHVEPERLVELTHREMASEQRRLEYKRIEDKALFGCQRARGPKATTNQFRCGRCGKKETTYTQLQTRSADEPMTTFVTCVSCGHRWKC